MEKKVFENITVDEAAARMGVTPTRVRQLLLEGRIKDATRSNPASRYRGEWAIRVEVGQPPVRLRPGP